MNARALLVLVTPMVVLAPTSARSQTIRISGVTTFQYLDLRPMAEDSITIGATRGDGLLRRSDDGYVVRCVSGDAYCRFRRPDASTSTLPAVQDLDVNVWGIARGVRAYARLRGRAMVLGDDELWPRADDRFDVMAAYVEMNRATFTGRAGRQWTTGLGYRNYDGLSLRVRPTATWNLEAYGGRSLVLSMNEPLTSDEFVAVESFAPDVGAYLIGARAYFRPNRRAAVTAMYQREIRTDRLGLYSERVALDGVIRSGAASVDATMKIDWATATLNEGRIRAWLPPVGAVTTNVYARHHDPFFELWTIWGAFNPLAFNEIGASATWQRIGTPVSVRMWAAGRQYVGAEAEDLFGTVRSNGWRLGTSATARLTPTWSLQGQYQADVGFGAAKSDGMARVQRDFDAGNYLALNVAAYQQLYEFRVDDRTVFALGADAALRRGPRTRIGGGLTAYHHSGNGDTPDASWTQLRGSLRIEWTVGPEPGVVARPAARP